MAETIKSKLRRMKEGWFQFYAPPFARGLEIGAEGDPLFPHWDLWDEQRDGDATHLKALKTNSYDVVYASHVLEHLKDPVAGVRSWFRVIKPLGNLVLVVPHRDLYERKTDLPSLWNPSHRWFWLPDKEEAPVTLSLIKTVQRGAPTGELRLLRVLDKGWQPTPVDQHAPGEYSIECVIRKPKL